MVGNKNSRSWKLAEKLVYKAFEILKENDGELQGRRIIDEVGQEIELDDWAKGKYEKSGIDFKRFIDIPTNKFKACQLIAEKTADIKKSNNT